MMLLKAKTKDVRARIVSDSVNDRLPHLDHVGLAVGIENGIAGSGRHQRDADATSRARIAQSVSTVTF